MIEHLPLILSYLAAIGFGGVVAAVVNHRFASGRESRAKRDDFRGFLGKWKREVQKPVYGSVYELRTYHAAQVVHLDGYAAKLDRDFLKRKEFRKLCAGLSDLKAEELSDYNDYSRQDIIHKIEVLINFV